MKQKNVILMVVAVGCGLVAAFLTSQMSAKGQVEQVEVAVATKDLPVGTMITREELNTTVKMKKLPKDGLPPGYVTDPEVLVNKRLSRPVRAEETFNPQDLSTGGAVTLPEGYDLVSLQVNVAQAAAGFVGPGSRVDVLASLRLGNTLRVFKLLVNTLVINVDQQLIYDNKGVFPTMSMVGFAVTDQDALLLELAKARGCSLSLKLRNSTKSPDADKDYNIEEIIRFLQDAKNPAEVKGGGDPTDSPEPKNTGTPDPIATPPAPPKIETVKVLIAKHDIAPDTMITKDLVAESFEEKELPKDFAVDALHDFTDVVGNAFKTGVSKNQWVTRSMVGAPSVKPTPRETFVPPKPDETPVEPVKPVEPPKQAAVKPKYHDVAIHTARGTIIHRYEEIEPGVWKKRAELTPEQAAQEAVGNPPAEPKAEPEIEKKID